jgi:hypothetical protein
MQTKEIILLPEEAFNEELFYPSRCTRRQD